MQMFHQKERLKSQGMLLSSGGKKNSANLIERQVHLAAQKYFRLYVHEWAENYRLEANSQEILIETLKDFFYFIRQCAEEYNLDANGQEILIEILKDSFYFIQQFLEDSKY